MLIYKMYTKIISAVIVFSVLITNNFAQICPSGAPVTFAKISSTIPSTSLQPILLYAATPGTAITAECYNRCQASEDCAGFILDYIRASCFRVPITDMTPARYLPARDSNFYLKICIQVPTNCTKRAWSIEYSPNSELIGYQQHVIPNVVDQWQCAQYCLNGATQFRYGQVPCYSAQYQHWSKTCTLSSENRRTRPEAFNPGVHEGVDYIENLCVEESATEHVGCWHEPVFNHTILEADLQIPNIDLEQCRRRCETEQYFPCRGFSYRCTPTSHTMYGDAESICYLHGDDSLTAGQIVPSSGTTYVERLTCIDLNVECSSNSMILTLRYKGFEGRMFAVGYADECGVSGRTQDITTLVLPVSIDPRIPDRCGVVVAQSIGYGNRKSAQAVVAIQRHPIIQTVGDRIAKVNCIIDDGTDRLPRPLFNNITLDVTFGVAEPPIQTSIVHEEPTISSTSPAARLRILDLNKGGTEASETILGEELELRIDIYPPLNTSMLRAGHLVASSGDGRDSLLLLDWRGCPPDPSTFPALTQKSASVLSAVFKAFRFPTSPIIKFSLLLSICDGLCQPTDCGNGLVSYGRRRKRTVQSPTTNSEDSSKQEVPLQLAIIVRAPETQEIYNRTEVSSASIGITDSDESVCVTWPALVTVCIAFGILQITLLAVCSCIYCWRKRKLQDPIKLSNDFQPRHVSWATDMPFKEIQPNLNRPNLPPPYS